MKTLALIICFLMGGAAFAQPLPVVTVSSDSGTFSSIVDALEEQTDYRFFYKNEWVDSLRYNFSFLDVSLNKVLDALVEGSKLNYYIADQQVFITYDVRIISSPKIAELLEVAPSEIQTNVERGLVFTREYQSGDAEGLNPEQQVFEIGERQKMIAGNRVTVAGYVRAWESGEPVSGVLVYSEKPLVTVTTDASGFYSITLPVGKNKLIFQLVGMKSTQRNLVLFSDGQLNVELEEDIMALQEVVIESRRGANVQNVQMGVARVNVAEVKNVPIVLGERDIMKVATTLAGIKTVGEGAAGFNVRGGKADQNLIILDGAPIYNTSHFLGFFSVFNSETIADMEIHKGSIPARFGGRLSSVMDISSHSANRDSIAGSGGISLVTSKAMVEVPLFKGKGGLMLGGRTTYSNWILNKIDNADFQHDRISFSDLVLRHDLDIGKNSKLSLSGYYSLDEFQMKSDTLFSASDFRYENKALSLGLMHQFSANLYSKTSLIYSAYEYDLSNDISAANAFVQDFDITEATFKSELSYALSDLHEISGGVEVKGITTNPGRKLPVGEESIVKRFETIREQALESAIFLADEYDITPALSMYAGVRYSMFGSYGPHTVYTYMQNAPINGNTKVDSIQYGNGEKIKGYHGLEPRVFGRFKIGETSSIKGGYTRTRQYIHTLTNSASLSPTDIWRLSNTYLKPQVADQFSLGYYRNFMHDKIETSLEGYYKQIQDLLDFKVGAEFLLNPQVETVTLQGPGKSYGLEFSIKKSGRLSGWINYTFSRTFIKLDSEFGEERINGGAFYPTNYDIPHTINLVANYKLTHRISFSYNFSFNSGRPITYPVGVYDFHGTPSIHYSDRNSYRIPHYMRMDLGINLEAGHKLGKMAYSYWSFSIYNLLGRDNPYSVFFNVEGNEIKGYKYIVFGIPIPTITYNFKF